MEDSPLYDELCERIIRCAIAVHAALGPGLLESIYRDCLMMALALAGLQFESEVRVPVAYRGRRIRDDLRLDLLVGGLIIVEAKSVALIHSVHVAQVMTYVKLADKPAGLLLNFNTTALKNGIRRVTHPDIYRKRAGIIRSASL
jgi:GxxExxY protein